MQIILSGLHGDVSEHSVEEGLAPFFAVKHVKLIREGVEDNPWALVEVGDPYDKVWDVCNRLRGVFHRGKKLGFYIPMHQEESVFPFGQHEHINIA